MSYFKGLTLTKKGEQLQAKINGNLSETLVFTKAKLGSGEITSDNEIRFLTDLKTSWGTAIVSNCEIQGNDKNTVAIELQFSNEALKEDKIFREIGLYARGNDGQEVLYAYANAGENYDYIPTMQNSPHTFIIVIYFKITTGTKISAAIDLKSYVTQENLNLELNKKIDKTSKSDSISSSSSETVATSKAVKTAYEKGVEALNTANTKLNAQDPNVKGRITFNNTAYGIRLDNSNKAVVIDGDSFNQFYYHDKNAYYKIFHEGNKQAVSWNDVISKPTSIDAYGFGDFDTKYLGKDNLNNITKTGMYGQSSNANATYELNYPVVEAGTLFVTPSAYTCMQMYIPFSKNEIYIRNKDNLGNWNAWKRVDGLDKLPLSGGTVSGNLKVTASIETNGITKNTRNDSSNWSVWKSVVKGGFWALEYHNNPLTPGNMRVNIYFNTGDSYNGSTLRTIAFPDISDKGHTVAYQDWVNEKFSKELTTENLNETAIPGLYYQKSNNNATVARNYPEQQAGSLLISVCAYGVIQEYTTFYSNKKFVRGQRDGGTWGEWKRIDSLDSAKKITKVWEGRHIPTVQNNTVPFCTLPADWSVCFIAYEWASSLIYNKNIMDIAVITRDAAKLNRVLAADAGTGEASGHTAEALFYINSSNQIISLGNHAAGQDCVALMVSYI